MEWWEKIKKLIEEKVPKNQEEIVELGKAFDDKVKEEYQQLKEMGLGAYVAQNGMTAAAKAARSVGLDEDAQLIEYLRSDAVRNGQEFDNKIKDAVKLVKENGLNATMADKGITVMVKAARRLGQEDLAEKVESKRETLVGVGQRIDNKVKKAGAEAKNILSQEYQQLKDMGGVGAYVAQNGATVVAETARRLGQEDLAEKVESKRETLVGVGQRIDNKVKEEIKQMKDMGVGEYVARNAISLDHKLEEKIQQLKNSGKNEAENLLNNDGANTSGCVVIHTIEQGAPVMAEERLENKGALGVSSYTNAEICHLTTKDGGAVEFTLLDGKKHGAEIHYAANGEISEIKVFDHGKEIPVDKRNVEIRKEVVEMGTHSYCLLDGKPFGTEVFTSTDGKARASFYEDGGFSVSRKSYAELSYTLEPLEQYLLHQELAEQKGHLREGGISGLRNNRIEQRLQSRQAAASVSEPVKEKQTVQTDVLAFAADKQR